MKWRLSLVKLLVRTLELLLWLVDVLFATIILMMLVYLLFPQISAAQADTLYVVTVSDYANVREKPDKGSEDVGDVYGGDILTGLVWKAGWVQVEAPVEAGSGWVREDLLTLADEQCPAGIYCNVSGGRVRIRRAPDSDKAVWLAANAKVTVTRWIEAGGETWAVTKRGYVRGDALALAEDEGSNHDD